MNDVGTGSFEFLNHGGRWPRFTWSGLELDDDGALRLAALPILRDGGDESLATMPTPDGPAGLVVGTDGSIYWSDPSTHQVWVRDGCDAAVRPLPCLPSSGQHDQALSLPRALLLHPIRQVLLIADSGNNRIQVFELGTWQLLAMWGGSGTSPGQLQAPTSLAADAEGNVYVADHGNQRVQKYDQGGTVDPAFWDHLRASAPELERPIEVAFDLTAGRLYVRDEGGRLLAVSTDGHKRDVIDISPVDGPLGLAADNDSIYLGANGRRRILRLTSDGSLIGDAVRYEGPVAALATDAEHGLWVLQHGSNAPLRLEATGGYVTSGALWGGPIGRAGITRAWQRLTAFGRPTADDTRFRFFLYTADQIGAVPPPDLSRGARAFDTAVWRETPANLPDVLVDAESEFLWIGVHFGGDGDATPVLEQLKVAFDGDGYVRHLPAIYLKKGDPVLLQRLLALFESEFKDVESQIEALARYFDPQTVPASWLDWLAGWLALDLEEDWPEEKRRRAVSDAFESYAWRGTARGLRAAIRLHTGIDVRIEEPLLHASWWSLPDDEAAMGGAQAALGFTTRLGGAQPQGAVLGTTAVLDQSQLITQSDFGAPLFTELAHQFSIYVHRAQVGDPDRLDSLHDTVQRQKPAHTAYQICVVEPTMLVGYQATLGVDTVVGGGRPSPTPLGEDSDSGVVLAGMPAGRLGHTRIGTTTRLGEGAAVLKTDSNFSGEPS